MKEVPVRLGPLALLLTVISICLTTLAILAFTTARADLGLAQRYADTVQERYSLEKEGQEYLAQVSDDLGDGMFYLTENDGLIWSEIVKGDTSLRIGIRPEAAGGYSIDTWKIHRDWEEDTSLGNLWDGTWN